MKGCQKGRRWAFHFTAPLQGTNAHLPLDQSSAPRISPIWEPVPECRIPASPCVATAKHLLSIRLTHKISGSSGCANQSLM